MGFNTIACMHLRKGEYKYDKVEWKQDYKGWKPRTKKLNIETNTFDPWPDHVYKQYDKERMELADEVLQRIEDANVIGQVGWVIRLCKPIDFQLLQLIVDSGPVYHKRARDKLGRETRDTLLRCKSRHLIVSLHQKRGYYKYDITPLGRSVLEESEKRKDPAYIPRYKQYQKS